MTTATFDPYAQIPACLMGAYDPCYHKSAADFAYMAQHELDLADEGEIEMSHKDRVTIERYLKQCEAAA